MYWHVIKKSLQFLPYFAFMIISCHFLAVDFCMLFHVNVWIHNFFVYGLVKQFSANDIKVSTKCCLNNLWFCTFITSTTVINWKLLLTNKQSNFKNFRMASILCKTTWLHAFFWGNKTPNLQCFWSMNLLLWLKYNKSEANCSRITAINAMLSMHLCSKVP